MSKEFIREIRGHKYKYLTYWDKAEKKSKQKGKVPEPVKVEEVKKVEPEVKPEQKVKK